MAQTVMITGVNGFIGRSMWTYLQRRKKNLTVYGLDQKINDQHQNIVKCNLSDTKLLRKYISQIEPDYIFHMAGGRMRNITQLRSSNITTTKNIFKALVQSNLRSAQVIIPGSAAEYGLLPKTIRRVRETYKGSPVSDYGKIKLEQSEYALGQAVHGFDVRVGRIFNILGANTPEQLVAGRFARQIVEIERNGKFGTVKTYSLAGKRDFLDIEDICAALWQVAISGRSGQIYNICSSTATEIEQVLLDLILNSKVTDVEIVEEQIDYSKSFNVVGSNVKLRQHTSWIPKVSMEQSIKKTLASYRTIKASS